MNDYSIRVSDCSVRVSDRVYACIVSVVYIQKILHQATRKHTILYQLFLELIQLFLEYSPILSTTLLFPKLCQLNRPIPSQNINLIISLTFPSLKFGSIGKQSLKCI